MVIEKNTSKSKMPDTALGDIPYTLADILTTEELSKRPKRTPDYKAESMALAAMAEIMTESSDVIFQKLVDVAMQLCHAGSAGISITDTDKEEDIFRWRATSGEYKQYAGGTMPRNFSPCGVVLDCSAPQLMTDMVKYYPYVSALQAPPVEVLLVPFYLDERPVGTVWVVAHSYERKFDLEDLRIVQSLTRFASLAVQNIAQESRMRIALKAGRMGTWQFDSETQELICSKTCNENYGISSEEKLTFQKILTLIHKDDLAYWQSTLGKAIETGEEFEMRYRVIWPDNSTHWIYVRGSCTARAGGKAKILSGVSADITDASRLRAITEGQKKALEMSVNGEALPKILEVLINVVEKTSRNGVRASVLLLSDDKKQLLLGAAPNLPNEYNEAVHGIAIGQGVGSCGTAAYLKQTYVATDISTDPYWQDFKEMALKHNLHACWSTPIVSSSNELLATFALYYDKPSTPTAEEYELIDFISQTAGIIIERTNTVSARRQLNQKLILARDEAESANLAKSEFLANMSHEIRTPMNAVIGLSTILAKSEGLSQKQKEYVRTLQLSADSLLELINDLLDISKIEARSIELEYIPFDITQLLEEVISMMALRAKEKGLEFTVNAQHNRRIFIGDSVRIRQIILNLCSNAIKFTEKGGVHISLNCEPTDIEKIENVSIAISDTGIGIAENKQKDIFQKFTQADSSINRKYGGTGLGLAITKTLAEIMGGSVSIKSIPGTGSTFTVTLPLKVADNEMAIKHNNQPQETSERTAKLEHRILLVEDYAANVLVTGTYLELFGYSYDVVDNGYAAVEKTKNENYLAVLMDVQMPGINGFESTKLIRNYEKQNNLPHIPIIGMTAHALAGDRERCIEAGMDDYISKPFNPDELEQKLSGYVGGEVGVLLIDAAISEM